METYTKMERKLIDITLPRREDKPKSLNTHSDKDLWQKSGILESLKKLGESLLLRQKK